jgi:hypothetical protein
MSKEFELISSLPIIEELVRILMSFKVPLEPDDISWWESLVLHPNEFLDLFS